MGCSDSKETVQEEQERVATEFPRGQFIADVSKAHRFVVVALYTPGDSFESLRRNWDEYAKRYGEHVQVHFADVSQNYDLRKYAEESGDVNMYEPTFVAFKDGAFFMRYTGQSFHEIDGLFERLLAN